MPPGNSKKGETDSRSKPGDAKMARRTQLEEVRAYATREQHER